MASSRRTLLAMIGASAVIAGCLGDDEDVSDDVGDDSMVDDAEGDDAEMNSDDADDADDMSTPTVQLLAGTEYGDILVGPDGLTLYMFDADEQGAPASECYDSCAENWPPLILDEDPIAGEGLSAELTTFEREDGQLQVAANGWPLYYWIGDEAEGDTAGQGVNDVWWVLSPDGEPIRDEPEDDADETAVATVQVHEHTEYGDILAGPDGLTLYMFDADEQGAPASECYDSCAENWPPLTVEDDPVAGDGVTAELTTFEREDGEAQVAANGWPLYYWVGDEEEGDTAGQGVNDVWWVLTSDGEPIRGDEDEPADADDEYDDGDDRDDTGPGY